MGSRKLRRRILSVMLSAAMTMSLMPANTAIADEIAENSESLEAESSDVVELETADAEEVETQSDNGKEESGKEVNTITFDATTLTAAADKENIEDGTKFADGYFKVDLREVPDGEGTLAGSVTKRTSKTTGNVTAIELSKWSSAAIKFTVKGEADLKVNAASTGSKNASAFALVKIADDKTETVVENNEKKDVVETTAATELTYTALEAGDYALLSPVNEELNRGARIISIEVKETTESESGKGDEDSAKDYILDAADLETGEKEKGSRETAGTDDAFEVIYYGTETKNSSVDEKAKTFEDEWTSSKRLNFRNVMSTSQNAIKFTVADKSTATVWWISSSATESAISILSEDGKTVASSESIAVKDEMAPVTTLDIPEAGTYYLGNTGANNYIFKVKVHDNNGSSYVDPVKAWADVAAPSVKSAEQTDGNIVVGVDAVISETEGGDKLVVNMTDASGNVIDSQKTIKEGTEYSFTFKPESTGKYYFTAVLSREGEEDKSGETSAAVDFVLPLGIPAIASATNKGSGSVEVKYGEVDEATGYLVEAYLSSDLSSPVDSITNDAETLSATFSGLKIGSEYTFKAYALRGDEKSEASSITATVKKEEEVEWGFTTYGASISTTKNGYEGNANDGEVTVFSEGGAGKIVPNSTDGLAYYYTTVDPKTTNFTLEANAHVNNWKYSNGQEGFGIMAADSVGEYGDGADFWNNSYMAVSTKVEYNYANGEVTDDSESPKYSMRLGVGSIARTGVDAKGLEELANGATIPSAFTTKTTTLETSAPEGGYIGGKNYNIVGNCENESSMSPITISHITDFKLKIQKNNTGYFVSYTDKNGKTTTKKYYDTEALSQLDSDKVYIGFFAARNANITFSDINYTTVAKDDDSDAEEREIVSVTPGYEFQSASTANSSDYKMTFCANWRGTVTVRNSSGSVVLKDTVSVDDVTAGGKVSKNVPISIGVNSFTATFVPDASWAPDEYTVLSDYSATNVSHSVTWRRYGQAGQALYVSADGTAAGSGTSDNPLDIYTAVKYAQPGQTIVLKDGRYRLTKALKIERGVNGTASAPISMVAENLPDRRDPFNSSGVIIDCSKVAKSSGFIMAGDYWQFKGFDVTKSSDGQKGIQLSGSHNLLEDINTYKNGNTGIQVSRLYESDTTWDEWPQYNTIRNCTSYLNSDSGYEDADGFAAKLTVGAGNVFDGCIAAYNADDGWDLYAKSESGQIGQVVIQNSIAYKNGYVLLKNGALDLDGTETDAGNGNGFKMGGTSITGYHTLKNSLAFANKAKGFDSNSCPDIQLYNSVAFDNESYNVAFYTKNANNTDFLAEGIISFRKKFEGVKDQLQPVGKQDSSKYLNASTFLYTEAGASVNSEGVAVEDSWFVSLDTDAAIKGGISRSSTGKLDTNGYLELSEEGKAHAADTYLGGTDSGSITIGDETDGTVDRGSNDSSDSEGVESDDADSADYNEYGLWIADIKEELTYTGKAVEPDVHVYMGTKRLEEGTDYAISFRNNKEAYIAGDSAYSSAKAPTIVVTGKGTYKGKYTKEFDISPKSIASDDIAVEEPVEYANGKVRKLAPAVTYNGKNLKAGTDYTLEYTSAGDYSAAGSYDILMAAVAGGNFTGSRVVTETLLDKNDKTHVMMKKAKISSVKTQYYTGSEIKPEITVSYKGTALSEGADYTVTYGNNVQIGTATVTIKGTGSRFVGTKVKKFKIKGGRISRATVSIDGMTYSTTNPATYKGSAITFGALKVFVNGNKLKKDKDYKLIYKGNSKAGTASVKIKGIKDYSGSIVEKFKINAYDIEKDTDKIVGGSIDEVDAQGISTVSASYTMHGTRPELILTIDGHTMVKDKDYRLRFKNNTKIASSSEAKAPTAIIKGINGLKGSIEVKFTINPTNIADYMNGVTDKGIEFKANDVYYRKNAKLSSYKTKIVVKDERGNALSSLKDYKVEYFLNKADNEHSFKTLGNAKNLVVSGDSIIARISASNKNGKYVGSYDLTYRVVGTSSQLLDNAKYTKFDDKYLGVNVNSDTVIDEKDVMIQVNKTDKSKNEFYTTDSKGNLVSRIRIGKKYLEYGKDFEVDETSYRGLTSSGHAHVEIYGKGDYAGRLKITYRVRKTRWTITSAEVSEITKTYTGMPVVLTEADLTGKIRQNGVALVPGTDFELVENSYKNNTKVGKGASVMIKGKGSYSGTKKIKFTIAEAK